MLWSVGEDVSTGHNYCQRSLLRRERRPRSKAGLPSCNKVNNDILILITRYCRWRKNIYKNAKTKQLFARRWQWVWAPWWTPKRFSFSSPAQTRPLPSTRCPFKHWCHDDKNDGFTKACSSGDWGGSLPHVDCVSFPAASKHDDHCRRGCQILTAWEHHILIFLVQFQHECTSGRNPWAASADSEILQGHVAGWKFSRRTSVQNHLKVKSKVFFFLNRCTRIWTSWATMRWGSWASDQKLTKHNFSKLEKRSRLNIEKGP